MTQNPDTHAFDAFIFDLDGTLLDTLPDLVFLTNKVLQDAGFPPRTQSEILSFVGNGARTLIHHAAPAGTSEDAADAVLAAFRAQYSEHGVALTTPYAGMQETLLALKRRGVRLGVLSNKFDGGVREIIERCLPGIFEVMHGECAQIPRKPDPSGLLRTIGELRTSPERCAYVGDSPGDVLTAHNAGSFSIAVTWGYCSRLALDEAKPDALIERPEELLNYL